MQIPEVDRAAWFAIEEANERILHGQRPFLDRLAAAVVTGRARQRATS
jgi:predicted NUDIX family NTP pyrophosphohydrolase